MRIELCYNKIESGLEGLVNYPLLRIVKMRYNLIATFEAIKPLSECKLLHTVEFFNNPVTELHQYRRTVYQILE